MAYLDYLMSVNDYHIFTQPPAIHPNSSMIKGVVCGVRVEEVDDPLMQKIRYLDKLIDAIMGSANLIFLLRLKRH